MISSVFVDRPRLAIVIAFVITIAGALALLQIPVAQFPDIVPPQVTVTAVFPGASAEVVESSVAQPLEAQVVGVDKMLYMKSTSGNDGSYTLTVSFALGTNPDINTVNVNNRVQTALAQLPTEVQAQGLTVQKKSSAVLQFIVLYSQNGAQDPLFITNYAIINVLDAISRTPGVGQASLFAKLNYSMRIWFDTQRLTSLNLAPSDVIAAIRAQSVQAPVGRIGARPIADDQQFQFNVQTQGRLTTSAQFGDIVLRANPDGSVLRIKDVARVEIGAQNLDSESRIDGQSGVPMGIYLAPGANAVTTAKAVQATLAKLSERFPPGLTYLVQYDSTTFVSDTITEVLKTLGEAFVLVVIVVFLFLGNMRATIIPAIAVPVSLIGTFAVLLVLGYSANTVSLLAMVLAIGIVVDDAIVVVENVERVMEEEPELSPAEATKKAMAQITAPIIAISLVLLSVFVPIAFIPGISGTLFRQFAVTISAAMVISALNALTLSPALCGVFLRHTGPRHGIMGRVLGGIDWVRDRYAGGVRRLLRMAAVSLVLVLVFAGGIFGVSRITPTGFLPEEDQGAFFIAVQLPDGASVARTSEVTKQVEALLKQMPQVAACAVDHRLLAARRRQRAELGLHGRADEAVRRPQGGDGFGAGDDPAHLRRGIADPASQHPAVQPAADHRAVDLRRLRISARGAGRPGPGRARQRDGRPDRRGQPRSPADAGVLDLHRDQSVDLSRHRPRQGAGARPQHERRVHRAAGHARRRLRQQLQPVRPHLAGQRPGRGGRSPRYSRHLADLRAQQHGRDGADPLDRLVADRDRTAGHHPLQQLSLRHVNGGPAAGISSGTAIAAMEELSKSTLPPGYSYEWTGTAYQEHEASGQTGVILALAMLFAYLFLVALYESWMIPVPVLLSVAVGVLGSYAAIKVAGLNLDLYAPDRPRGADRAGRQERHPDRRIRQGAARGRAFDRGSGDARLADAVPCRDDDLDRLHPRPAAAGGRDRRRADQPARRRHGGVRRHAGGKLDRHFHDPDALRDVPGACASGLRGASADRATARIPLRIRRQRRREGS